MLRAKLFACLALLPAAASAATFSIVANIPGGPQIGAIRGSVLYGTLPCQGAGELFSLTTAGTVTMLHSFAAGTEALRK